MADSDDRSRFISRAPPPISPVRGGLSNPARPFVKFIPDWNYWRQIPTTALWKAVTLSCNVDPRKGGDAFFFNDSDRWGEDPDRNPEHREFLDRIDIASANFGAGDLVPASINMGDGLESRVHLQQFAAWCIKRGWEIPSGLSAISQAVIENERFEFDPESETYPPELDIAMQAWRYAMNNRNRSAQPKQLVRDFLKNNYKGVSGDAAERIATVCNWAKKGGAPVKK